MIKKIAIVAVAVGGLTLPFAAPADATPSSRRICSFNSISDPTVEPGTQIGQVNGGPITDSNLLATMTLTCTIQVGGANNTHAGVDAASASATGTNVAAACIHADHQEFWDERVCPGVGVTLPPTQISYTSTEGQPVYLCTEVSVNGTVYYYDDASGSWSASASATCGEAIQQDLIPEPLFSLINSILEQVDPTICPFIAMAFPPEGDVLGVYDCPPYGG